MSAQTVSTASTPAQLHEEWRDQMIELGIETYWSYETTGHVDTDAAVTVANALNDIRVRDCLLWHMVRYSCPDLVTAILNVAIPLLPGKPGSQAALVAAIAFAMQGKEEESMFAVGYALNYDRDNRMAQLAGMTLSAGGAELLKQFMEDEIGTMDYDTLRVPVK